jgi:protein TonB
MVRIPPRTRRGARWARWLLRRLQVVAGAAALTLGCFLVLPLMQTLGKAAEADLVVRALETAEVPPPPPPVEQEPEKEEPEVEPPPELADEAPPLDLAQLELALQTTTGEGWLAGDFGARLGAITTRREDVDALFSVADLDQKPRVTYQPSPVLNAELRRKAPGSVYVVFVVDPSGKVEDPVVKRSTDPVFERPALAAVKQWRFEPGKKDGRAVRFRMGVPITFLEGGR